MNITQAKAAMRRLFGKNAMWCYDEKAPTAEDRERVRALMPSMVASKNEAKEAMDAKRRELLADPEYVRLRQAYEAAEQVVANARGIISHYRVSVGRDTGFAFHIVAQGDNWHDAIDKAKAAAGAK